MAIMGEKKVEGEKCKHVKTGFQTGSEKRRAGKFNFGGQVGPSHILILVLWAINIGKSPLNFFRPFGT